MEKKVILISIDGMRPDGLQQCGNPYVKELEKMCAYTYSGSSVFPSVTLPCHFSMTHSAVPQRHGILTNTYVPQVRPIKGLFEVIKERKGVNAMFYGWEPLRDIGEPGSLQYAAYVNAYAKESVDTVLTDKCIEVLEDCKPDFAFLYLVDTDDKGGHDAGWMTEEYLRRISVAIDNVKRIFQRFGKEYSIVIMADHGGHDRSHGTMMPEDMTIPFFFYGKDFAAGEMSQPVSLLEIAPTIVKIMGIEPDSDWDGHAVF